MAPRAGRVGPGKMIVTLYFDADLVKRIDRLAAADDRSRSKYIEDLVKEGIDKQEMAVRTMTDPVIAPVMMKALASPEVLRALLSMMRTELTDEQLSLFQQTMAAASVQVQKKIGRASAQQSPRRGRKTAGNK